MARTGSHDPRAPSRRRPLARRDDRSAMDAVDDIEASLVAHWSHFGRWSRGRLQQADGLLWFESPIAHLPYNGVIDTRLGAAAAADRAIAAAVDRFAARGVEFIWFAHPSATPADLGERLAAHGLQPVEPITCMSLDLADRAPLPPAGAVTVRQVSDEAGARAYADLTVEYWQIPASEQPLVEQLHREWPSSEAGVRYLALVEGRAVGKAYLSLAGPPGVAAIFGMTVRPEARGRGVASELTATLLQAARDAGCRRVVLHSTEQAVGVYRRAGFVERCPLTIFATAPLWTRGDARVAALTSRPATHDDLPALEPLIRAAIDQLQKGYLDDAQIRSSHAIMALDQQLIADGTYFVAECDGRLAGCGGWSRRAALYSDGRGNALLDPSRDAARIRAMYTHPDFRRRGVARLILSRCEAAAAAEGFTRFEVMSTLAGAPLYATEGFEPIEEIENPAGGVPVPLIRMRKTISRRDRP